MLQQKKNYISAPAIYMMKKTKWELGEETQDSTCKEGGRDFIMIYINEGFKITSYIQRIDEA